MNITELAKELAPQFDMSANKTEMLIRATFQTIANEMAAGNEVSTPLGIFRSRIQPARSGVMGTTGQSWHSPEKQVPKLSYSKSLKQQVMEGVQKEVKSPLEKEISKIIQLELGQENSYEDLLAS